MASDRPTPRDDTHPAPAGGVTPGTADTVATDGSSADVDEQPVRAIVADRLFGRVTVMERAFASGHPEHTRALDRLIKFERAGG
ncbi:MAG: hypothetical protein AAF721_00165 [Myxococcota bacterium]